MAKGRSECYVISWEFYFQFIRTANIQVFTLNASQTTHWRHSSFSKCVSGTRKLRLQTVTL